MLLGASSDTCRVFSTVGIPWLTVGAREPGHRAASQPHLLFSYLFVCQANATERRIGAERAPVRWCHLSF
jgi:hypothetical protein